MSASKPPARLKRPVSITHGSPGDNSGQDSDGETIVCTPGTSVAESQSIHSGSTFSSQNSGQRTPTASEMSGSITELGGPAKSTVEGKFVKLDSERGLDVPDAARFEYWKEMHQKGTGAPALRYCYKFLGPGIHFKLAQPSLDKLLRSMKYKQAELNNAVRGDKRSIWSLKKL